MSSPVDRIATPLVRGVLAALSSLGVALAVVVVPALAAQVAGTASTATALDAILIGLGVLVLGHGGGLMLATGVIDGAVTLTPFGLLAVFVLLSALAMRRVGRALRPVRADGVLREAALRDSGAALGAYAAVYALGLALLAGIGRSAESTPVVTSAVVSGLMVAVLGGLLGLLWSLRREPTEAVPGVRVLELLPAPYGEVARAVLIALIGLFGVGMAVVVVLMLAAVPDQAALFAQLSPGIVGGLVLTLLQLALLPLVAVWALTVVLGGTLGVGTSTGISLDGAETGVLPALPMLGALPAPGDFPALAWMLMLLPAAPVALGAVRLVGDVEGLPRRERLTAWIAYPLAVIVLSLVLAGLSTGGIGDGRLVHLGPRMSTLALPLSAVVAVSCGAVFVVLATGLLPWMRRTVGGLRSRVEAFERTERTERGERGERGERAEQSAASGPSAASGSSAASARSATSPPSAASAGSASSAASAASARTAASAGSAPSPASAGSAPSAASAPSAGTDWSAGSAPSAASAASAPSAAESAETDATAETDAPADDAPEADAWTLTDEDAPR